MAGWFEQNGYVPSNGNTGIAGTINGRQVIAPGTDAAGNAMNSPEYLARLNAQHPEYGGGPDYSTAGQYAPGHGSGYDPNKVADATKGDSAKYQLARIVSHFDGTKGLNQPGLMEAINNAGFGTFRADKDGVIQLVGGGSKDFGRTTRFDILNTKTGGWEYGQKDKFGGQAQMPSAPAPVAAPAASAGGGNYGGGGGGYASGGGQPAGLSLNGPIDPFKYEEFRAPDPFKAPTIEEAQNDPGYAFGRDQGLKAMQASAAAKGILRDTSTLQNLERYGNDYASTKYNDVVNRNLAVYNRNYDSAFQTNQANNGGRLGAFNANTNAALGFGNLDTANRNVDLGYTRAGNDFSLGQGQLALGNKQADQGYAINKGNLGLGWANYGLNADQQQFNQGYSLADMGLRAATNYGNFGSTYAQNAGNNATGAGNALAAGRIGSANAWNQGLTGAINGGMGAYGMYQYGQAGR